MYYYIGIKFVRYFMMIIILQKCNLQYKYNLCDLHISKKFTLLICPILFKPISVQLKIK